MVALVRALILVLSVSCAGTVKCAAPEPTPGLRFLVDIGPPKTHQEALRRLVQKRVSERFGDVSGVETRVWWVDGRLRYKGKDYWGLCFKCTEIYVLDHKDLCSNSYIHELIHCYHSSIEGWRDFEHANSKWWELVEELKAECAANGW